MVFEISRRGLRRPGLGRTEMEFQPLKHGTLMVSPLKRMWWIRTIS
jgi:hypothetical protein